MSTITQILQHRRQRTDALLKHIRERDWWASLTVAFLKSWTSALPSHLWAKRRREVSCLKD